MLMYMSDYVGDLLAKALEDWQTIVSTASRSRIDFTRPTSFPHP